jgi:hypothetical protein
MINAQDRVPHDAISHSSYTANISRVVYGFKQILSRLDCTNTTSEPGLVGIFNDAYFFEWEAA